MDNRDLARMLDDLQLTRADVAKWAGFSRATLYALLAEPGHPKHRPIKPEHKRAIAAGLEKHGTRTFAAATRLREEAAADEAAERSVKKRRKRTR